MALRVKIDPIERVTTATLRADLSLPEQKAAAAAFARQGIEDAKAHNKRVLGAIPPYVTTVDGRQGAPLESVNPYGGQIITEFELVGEVLVWIATELVARSPMPGISPFSSGLYSNSHMLFADGVEVDASSVVQQAEEYVFLNPLPYSRKLEIGKTKSGRDFLVSVPNRIYERTADDAKRRFSNIARIKFSYRSPIIGYQAAGTAGAALSKRGGIERETRVPAIIVTMRA